MNLIPEYREVLPLFFKRVTEDNPRLGQKERKRLAEKLAREFVVQLKMGAIKA